MTKGSYPVMWNGKIHGHQVYVEGKGWVYRPTAEARRLDCAQRGASGVSAECSKHGTDLVYPAGSWPVGVCEICEKDDEFESLNRLYLACRDDYERLWALLEEIEVTLAEGSTVQLPRLRAWNLARSRATSPRKDATNG